MTDPSTPIQDKISRRRSGRSKQPAPIIIMDVPESDEEFDRQYDLTPLSKNDGHSLGAASYSIDPYENISKAAEMGENEKYAQLGISLM